jgi:hypothetical protein
VLIATGEPPPSEAPVPPEAPILDDIQESPPDTSGAPAEQTLPPAITNNDIPQPDAADERAQRAEKRAKDDLKAQQDMAWAAKIGLILIGATVFFAALAWKATKQTNKITREIGEAQVRAYVSIVSATMQFGTDYEHPFVSVQVKNSGQSPARNFRWNPTIQYIVAEKRCWQSPKFDDWRGGPGVDLESGNTVPPASVMVPEMSLRAFTDEAGVMSFGRVLMRVRIEFEFVDVFKKTITDEIFFAGIAENQPRTDMDVHKGLWSDWVVDLKPMTRPKDWDDFRDSRKIEKTAESQSGKNTKK